MKSTLKLLADRQPRILKMPALKSYPSSNLLLRQPVNLSSITFLLMIDKSRFFICRLTGADANKDRKTTNRKLDRHLLFVVQQATEGKKSWMLPSTQWTEGESLRQTAERALKDHIDPGTHPVRMLGNAPWGVHTIKYPSSVREKKGVSGVKIFFFKAQLLSQSAQPRSAEYSWLGREELKEFLEPEYLRSVSQFLIDED